MGALETQELALRTLQYASEHGHDDPLGFVDITPLMTEHQISDNIRFEILRYLEQKGLIEVVEDSWSVIKLTSYGVDQLADALRQPDQPTESFPPVINVLHIGSVHGGQIQQGTHHSTQNGTFTLGPADVADLQEIVTKVKGGIPKIASLLPSDQQEALDYAEAVERNLRLPKPKEGFIKSSLQSLQVVLEGAAGDVVGAAMLGLVRGWLAGHGIAVP